jgi:Zn-dependent protease
VLALLPPDTGQAAEVRARLDALSRRIEKEGAGPSAPDASGVSAWRRLGGPIGAVGGAALLVWKFKALLLLVAGKAKLLLLGLTKSSTLLSMLASVGVYWAAWGWKFALGLVASIYVHEIGHVAALRRFGVPASAPMFVPGLGAFVRSSHYPANAREDARIGLAGPLWGLAACLAAYAAHLATGFESLAAIARVGAWINLFNLLPVATLDGGRGFRSLSRAQRWGAVAAIAAAWAATGEGLLLLLGVAGAIRAAIGEPAREPDWIAFGQYAGLVAVLAAATRIPVVVAP